ncbi:MAG: hypothetical protein IJG42_11560 [Muribaculaceae bacterium]|nr:hypothetical protein [Muribaculaceae bacterium]
MKKIILLIMGMLALNAGAQDRFYIEDFSIAPGETCTVSIMLDNQTAYTAFQTDIYLPEGLTVEQEDGDYIFGLTSRKARDHNIASQLQTNGSIRIMSYSPRINAYSGNSGALVTFEVTASVDFTGTAVMALRNTLFTTTAGVEIRLADEVCHVTVPVTSLKGDVNGDGFVNISDVTALINYQMSNGAITIVEDNADMNDDNDINITDVTILINTVLKTVD